MIDGMIEMDYYKRYEEWLNNPAMDEATKAELAAIKSDSKEIEERFHKDLEFGTGGLRGVMGAGTNRMNIYTVGRVSQGLASYILDVAKLGAKGSACGAEGSSCAKKRGVAISYDSRHNSRDFAMLTANIMVKNGINAFVFEEMRPTPQLSFAVRELGCIAGVMITASHNPPEYNGYKAFWEDGAQLIFPQDEEVIKYVERTPMGVLPASEAPGDASVSFLTKDMDEKYMAKVLELSLNPDAIKKAADDFIITYTPLNGTGKGSVDQALLKAGFKHIHIVPEQAWPDSNFSTLKYPNPEDPAAFALAEKLALQVGADIIIATDPDADRMGAMVKNSSGNYELLSGNSVGILLSEYILSQRVQKGTLPKNAALVSTVVSTRLTSEIAKAYGVAYGETFTGFKHIAKQVRDWEQEGSYKAILGFEESYGYMTGDFVRDKDSISASMLICEIAAFYKAQGKTLFDALDDIYQKYGYFKELGHSVTLPGLDGVEKIRQMMVDLRENPPEVLAGIKVAQFRDYEKDEPPYPMLYFKLADDSWFCVRPSGTEPKCKIYAGVKAETSAEADARMSALSKAIFKHMGIE